MSPSLIPSHSSLLSNFGVRPFHDKSGTAWLAVPLAFVETLIKSVFPYFSIFTPAFFNALKV